MKRFALAASLTALVPFQALAGTTTINFPMVVSAGAKTCLPNATAIVIVRSFGDFENLEVFVQNLPANTGFDLFNLEVPHSPFGLAWYLGDITTDDIGKGVGNFVGRFNRETFIISPGDPTPPPPPNTFPSPPAVVPEATKGVTTNPVQIYHLGLWFNSSADAGAAGCATTATPFNGEHNAGIQVLNTSNFPDNAGPLLNLQ
jgi:hypothetical protein